MWVASFFCASVRCAGSQTSNPRSSPSFPAARSAPRTAWVMRFGLRPGHSNRQRRLVLAVALSLGNRPQVCLGDGLIALAVRQLLDPSELIQFGKPVGRAAVAQGFSRLAVVAVRLADD